MTKFFSRDPNDFNQRGDYLERSRLHKLFKEAMDYPLVVVCAGTGYGKTHAVHSFLRKYDAQTAWLHISERDNLVTRFWESYASVVSLALPKFGARLVDIGFPESNDAFANYKAIVREVATLPGRQVRVFDDFHLLRNPAVLRFFERAVKMLPPNMTVVLISRTTPDFNLIDLMMRGRVFTVQEDTMCFTEDEIAEYFGQIKLSVTGQDIRNIHGDTQGWAFAVNLIGRSLIKEHKYERYALEAMKKNIFRFIEAEISQTVSEPLWRFLLRLSLIDHLAAGLIKELAKDDALIKEMESLNAYIRYDFSMDTYLIHHLFLDYLKQKQGQTLTDEERKETYQVAGMWCDANNYHTDAYSYYEKSMDYAAITTKVASYNIQMPLEMARYVLEIFDRTPDEAKSETPLFPSMYLKLKINMGQLDEALALAKQYAEDYESRPESPERNRDLTAIYAFWAHLRMKMCTQTDVYDFDIYCKKMRKCFDKSPFRILGKYNAIPSSAWASHVGTNRAEAHEEFIGAVSRAVPHISHVLNGFYTGFDDLVRGELCFYRGEMDDAEKHLKQSADKAQTCDQCITQNRALVYLMHIAFYRGDLASADKYLKTMETLLSEKNYGVRYTMYDIACGFYQLALGQPERIPEWLKRDFSPYTHTASLENYSNRIKARYHYQTRQYSALLAAIENALEQPQQRILFSKIGLKVLYALSLHQLKRSSEAIAALTDAYNLAESNKIIIPFVQYAKDMRTLTAIALRDEGCQIPKEWLKEINRKSSAYAKRKSKVISEYRSANNLGDEILLTEREIAILKDLSQGLSRTEIAADLNISVNTVKRVISIIYDKLYVASLPDAIRVAVNRKLI